MAWWGGGKNIQSEGFGQNGNTCASRMSVALNKSGAPIVGNMPGVRTIGAADGSRIIFAVADMRTYLAHTLGNPDIDNTSPFDDKFKNKKGILAFSVNWTGASGHIALWNGATYREPAHDNFATYVHPVISSIRTSRGEFWELI
ncbi:T6SS effector amidase Tae4 family protein [Nitrospirillum pindoramense]|uniref:T6SS effector amidase Tae4 family protein n=1 Tax=Nitrospirillum amazonense TaxID=28077 RepID=UPI0011A15F3A